MRQTLDKLPLPEDVAASVDFDPYQLLQFVLAEATGALLHFIVPNIQFRGESP